PRFVVTKNDARHGRSGHFKFAWTKHRWARSLSWRAKPPRLARPRFASAWIPRAPSPGRIWIFGMRSARRTPRRRTTWYFPSHQSRTAAGAGYHAAMNGMLLAAGRGERMEPLSSVVAKPALEVL